MFTPKASLHSTSAWQQDEAEEEELKLTIEAAAEDVKKSYDTRASVSRSPNVH